MPPKANVVNGGNIKGMSAVIPKRRSTLFVARTLGILLHLVSVTASTITRCIPSTSLLEVGGTPSASSAGPPSTSAQGAVSKTGYSEEVTAASPLTT